MKQLKKLLALNNNHSLTMNQNCILEKQINYANLSVMYFQQNIPYLNPRDGKVWKFQITYFCQNTFDFQHRICRY